MATDLKSVLGAKVRAGRESAGLSQEQLAERINRTPETISNIERGKTMPAVETLQALCSALGLRLAELFADEDLGRDADRVAREHRVVLTLRTLSESDLEVAQKTIEALANRPQR